MSLIPTMHRRCHQVYFADRSGAVCLISESVQNRPILVVGVHGHAMLLGPGDVRDMLPLLERFARTGMITTEADGLSWEI